MSCGKSELCIFDRATPQIVVDNACFEEIFPVNSISGNTQADIEFNIMGSNLEYLDLNDTLLHVEIKVVNDKNKSYDQPNDIIPINYMFHTLFKDVTLTLNTEKIEGGNGTYCQKALLETIINYGTDTRETSLTSIGYDESPDVRKAWIENSKPFNMCGSLQLDFLDQPKYLIPGVNVHLRLQRNKSSMSLYSATLEPRIQFISTKLLVRRVKVEPSVLMGHQIGLNTRNAIYPIRKTKLVTYLLSPGILSFNKDQIFGDNRLPKFVMIAFQNNSKYNGSYTEDCGTYNHCNISSLTLSKNSDFREVYTQNFSEDNYVSTYVSSMIRNMGHLDKNLNNGISMKLFKEKYPFFTFVLSPDFDISQTQLPGQGNLKVDVKFNTTFDKSVTMLIYGVFDDEIQINKNRTVFT